MNSTENGEHPLGRNQHVRTLSCDVAGMIATGWVSTRSRWSGKLLAQLSLQGVAAARNHNTVDNEDSMVISMVMHD